MNHEEADHDVADEVSEDVDISMTLGHLHQK